MNLFVKVSRVCDGAPASTPVHGLGAASDFYGECSSLVSVPKVVSAIDSFNFMLATATSALLFFFALDFCHRRFIERLKEFEFGYPYNRSAVQSRLCKDVRDTRGCLTIQKYRILTIYRCFSKVEIPQIRQLSWPEHFFL